MICVRKKLYLSHGPHGRRVIGSASTKRSSVPSARVPRIARLMALAIRFDRLVRDGTVRDQSELARLARVTQPRATQLMNLTLLAPDIQEALLTLPGCESGREPVHERLMRPIAAIADWREQRRVWRAAIGG